MTPKGHVNPLYFDPVRIGQSLQEVGVDYLQVEAKEIETRWFRHAESETDVFVWLDKHRQIIKQQVSHMGLLTEWNVLDGLKTGCVFEAELDAGESADGQQHPASELIQFDIKVQAHTLTNALKIIENMGCLSEDIKEEVTLNFLKPEKSLSKPSSERVVVSQSYWTKFLNLFKK